MKCLQSRTRTQQASKRLVGALPTSQSGHRTLAPGLPVPSTHSAVPSAQSRLHTVKGQRYATVTRVAEVVTTQTHAKSKTDAGHVELDRKYSELQKGAASWANMPLAEKVVLLEEIQGRLLNDMYAWGKSAAAVQGRDNDEWACAEGTLINAVVMNDYIKNLIDTFKYMAKNGKVREVPIRTLENGQKVARVWPVLETDKEPRLEGTTVDLYIKPGCEATQGSVYIGDKQSGGKVAALLGAGNFGFLGFKDILHSLFEQNNVVMFKPHPIQGGYHRYVDEILEPLRRRGAYSSFYTDSIELTRDMLMHPAVQCVHMTGGTATHDAIVWGPTPEEQKRRKAAKDPLLKVPITSELGCVTPWIISGGNWTEAEIAEHAGGAARILNFNNGCACNGIKVLVLPENWAQADQFINKMKEELSKIPLPPAFYPGHNQRYNAWLKALPNPQQIRPTQTIQPSREFKGAEPMPYAIQELPYPKPGEPLTKEQQYAFTVEPFAPVLTIVRIPAPDHPSYLSAATDFCNDRLWGTLSCSVFVHPDVQKAHTQAVDKMLNELRYGGIALNAYSAVAYSASHSTWGAYDGGQTTEDIGSGLGFVNNTLLFDHPQKTVVRMPFINMGTPKAIKDLGLPVWAFGPLTGLLVGGVNGLVRSVVPWR